MKKSIWITALDKDEVAAKKVFTTAQRYGLDTGGHFWEDDLEKLAWSNVAPELLKPENHLWIICGARESFAKESVRFGLSMLALMLHDRRGHGFPIIMVPYSGTLDNATLPTPLKDAETLDMAKLGAKVAAKANIPIKPVASPYLLRAYPIPGLGLWYEVGPAQGGSWSGGLFGVSGAEITAHGVGPSGKLPEKAVLEYPMKGLTLQSGETEFTAWGVKNALPEGQSYYARVQGSPAALIFGELPESDDADVYVVGLQ